jgi:hypothetical protein
MLYLPEASDYHRTNPSLFHGTAIESHGGRLPELREAR